jgi:cell division protease FtsH
MEQQRVSEDVIKSRVREINEVGAKLKTEFAGIDKQIDTIIRYVTPFYATPELLTRPIVVCLWGMTGVGKTHVLRRLANLTNMQSRYATFDMGEYSGGFSEYTLRYQLDDVADTVEDGRAMIVFDEMQTIRFIDETGSEVDRPAARLIWDVLDGAPMTRNTSFNNDVLEMVKDFKRLRRLGVTIEKNTVVSGTNHFKKIRRRWSREDSEDTFTAINSDDFETMYRANPVHFNYNEDYEAWLKVFEEFKDINDFISYIQLVSDGYKLGEPNNLSRSLIFCVGNLDEVYHESHDISPDIDIESLREYTEKVTLSQVKTALLDRFRPEQIARLGNNHVIYPSLDRNSYWKIIRKHISNSLARVKSAYNVDLNVDESVAELIFKESVFPTQGARPVNNSFSMLFDSYLADALCQLPATGPIDWKYDATNRKYQFSRGESTYSVDVQLMVESQRDNEENDKQAIIAVHEAGHGLAAALYTGRWPKELRSRTAGTEGGYTTFEPLQFKTRNDILGIIKQGMAGIVAEEVIYGVDNISNGSGEDFSMITKEIQQAVAALGLFRESWIGTSNSHVGLLSDSQSMKKVSQIVIDLIKESHSTMVEDFIQHKELILRIAEYLISHTVMPGVMFAEMCEKHGVKLPTRFSHRESLLQSLKEINS